MRTFRLIFCLLAASLLAAGCTTTSQPQKSEMAPSSASPVSYLPPVQPRHAGSLWSAERHLRLYDDLRARQVGDVVTVQIVENAQASKKANTQSDREQELDASLDTFLGHYWKHPATDQAGGRFGAGSVIKTQFNNTYQGTGQTDRQDTMSAYMACRVIQVLPEGNLYIKGTRLVQVNFEHQTMSLEGVIRPNDISPDNVVLSTRVAEAKIAYTGTGPVSDKQRPGWLSRLLDILWPF